MKLTEMSKTTLLENIYPVLHPQLHSDAVSVQVQGMEDIEMGFRFNLSDTKIGVVTKQILETYCITIEELIHAINTNHYEYQFETLTAMLGLPAEFEDDMFPIYVLTNKQRFYGAGAFCVKSIVHDVMETLKCDIFIFPSSKHELLIVPAKQCGISTRELTQMVHQINQDTVEPADRLSDNIYHLCYETGILSTIYYTE